MKDPTAQVQHIYQLFGRGEIPAILEMLSPDVEWEHDTVDHGVPWLRPGRGRAHAAAFFGELSKLEWHAFVPEAFTSGGAHVGVFVRLDVTVKATGKRLNTVELHWWTLDDAGRVVKFKHFADTKAHLQAATGA